jgi:hypothetical protein
MTDARWRRTHDSHGKTRLLQFRRKSEHNQKGVHSTYGNDMAQLERA